MCVSKGFLPFFFSPPSLLSLSPFPPSSPSSLPSSVSLSSEHPNMGWQLAAVKRQKDPAPVNLSFGEEVRQVTRVRKERTWWLHPEWQAAGDCVSWQWGWYLNVRRNQSRKEQRASYVWELQVPRFRRQRETCVGRTKKKKKREREKQQQKKALLTKKDCEQDEEKWGGQGGTGPGLN